MKKKSELRVLQYSLPKKLLMELKIAVFIVLVSVTNLFATPTYSQVAKVTLDMENKTLEQVMDEIERQSEFYFLFNQKQIDVDKLVTIQKKEILIDEVLDNIFDGTDINHVVIDRKILLTKESLEDEMKAFSMASNMLQEAIRGTVTDAETGEPMVGVNVQVKGTTIGAITDLSGDYTLLATVASDAILVFSFIGYAEQEVPVAGRQVVDVQLASEVLGLKEVIVVGYGTQKKETLTGAISQISTENLVTTKTTSVVNSLQGKFSGILIRSHTNEPGVYDTQVSIRGFGEPLLVIDGVARDGMSELERLNPNDIESISTLKDASSAIFGMNANNGVIIVTTKHGLAGKTKFSYSTFVGVKRPTWYSTAFDSQEDAYTYRVMRNEMDRNIGVTPTYSDSELEKWRLGTEPGYQNYDWIDMCLKDHTWQQQHNLSLSGGSDRTTFYASLGYLEDNGLLKSETLQWYKKYNFRSNFTTKITNDLTAKISFSGKFDIRKTTPRDYWNLYKHIVVADHGVGPYAVANPNHYSVVPAENYNPLAQTREEDSGYRKFENFQYQSSIDLTYEAPFLEGLSFKVLGAYDGYLDNESRLTLNYLMYGYLTDTPVPVAKSSYSNNVGNFNRKVFQAQVNYNTNIGQDHEITGALIYEAKSNILHTIGSSRYYDQVYTHDIIDQGSLGNLSNNGNRTQQAFMSILGRFNYSFRNKYLLEFIFREDGSYRYAPSQKWAFFPAVSAGWRMSEEPFIKNNIPIISNLKLRGSYGMVGSDAGSPFQYIGGYSFSDVSGGYVFSDGELTLAMIAPGIVNSNLSWVKNITSNIGIDVGLWKGKLSIEADVFQRKREGLLATRIVSVPNTFGATFPQENLNEDMVKGFEVMISHRGKINDIEYGVSANVTYARSYRVYTEREPYRSTMEEWTDSRNFGNNRIEGWYRGYVQDGFYTDITEYETAPLIGGTSGNSKNLPGSQRVVDVNGDGIINTTDRLPSELWAGSGTNPPLQYGSTLFASWKGFDINVVAQGGALFHIRYNPGDIYGWRSFPTFWTKYFDRWHTEDPTANPYDPVTEWISGEWPALKKDYSGTTDGFDTPYWRLPGTYLKIKSLEIGYTIPSNILQKIRMDNVRVYVNAYNLYTFCTKKARGFDPERNEGTYTAFLDYPLMAAFNLGINIDF